ncbi:MAG: hypothetical protein MUC97_12775 [Bernardetiaceae bacterium]|jgi:hypothetical protein|nr:hypothetical protein [Bernardetiaceae bacterium]
MEGIFIMGFICSIPVVAILANTLLKLKKIELEKLSNPNQAQLNQMNLLMGQLAQENQALRQRLENLETIVALGDSPASLVANPETRAQSLPPANENLTNLAPPKLSGEIAKILEERKK